MIEKSIKITIIVHTNDAVKNATEIMDILTHKNLPYTKVEQLKSPPKKGELAGETEWLNIITLLVSSRIALETLKAVLGILKGRWVDLPKARIEAETAKYIADAEKEVKLKEIELKIENGDKKYAFKLTEKDDE